MRASLAALVCFAVGVAPGASAQEVHLLVVTGLGGTPEYEDQFHSLGLSLVDAAGDRWGLPADRITWLAEDPSRAPARIAARSTRDELEAAVADIAGRARAGDRMLLVLIGHGTATGDEAKFNLPGPDLTPDELAAWLSAFPSQTVAVVNTASASGAFVGPLSGDDRIVVTATRSAREAEWTHFPEFFVQALVDDGADVDKDGRVSLLEAFEFTRGEVARRYERDGQLLTEHALLEDDGDGEGSLEPGLDSADGRLAARFHVTGPTGAAPADVSDDPRLAGLVAEKSRLEDAIADLRARSDAMERSAYESQLEELLLDLAAVNAALREEADEQ